MARTYCDYLQDMVTHLNDIQSDVNGHTFDSFVENTQLKKATLFSLQVVGEAAGKIPESIRASYPDIPWQKINDFRNQIVHAYFNLNEVMVWAILENHLSGLHKQLLQVLAEQCPDTEDK